MSIALTTVVESQNLIIIGYFGVSLLVTGCFETRRFSRCLLILYEVLR